MRSTRTLLAVAAAAALLLTGCGGTPAGTATDADPAATSTPSAADAADEPDTSTDEPTDEPTDEADPGPAAFGQTFTYEDGIAVTITAPKKFTPTDTSSGAEGPGTPMKFQITIKNGSTKTFDPSMANATVQSGEAEAEQIFDSAKNILGAPETKVLKGKTVKYTVGFNVLNTKDIVMEFAPSWEHSSAIFTNNP